MKHFYSHLVEIESLIIELDQMDFSTVEKKHLAHLIDSNIHQVVLDTVLSELSDEDKQIFLDHLSKNAHAKIWQHLNAKVNNIEDKIRKAAEDLKEELHEDINKSKRSFPFASAKRKKLKDRK